MVVFLSDNVSAGEVESIDLPDNLDQEQTSKNRGTLRLYPNGDKSIEGVVDISPRLGRAVLFKSEQMLH